MAGVLSFALVLETSAFSAGLDRAGGRLLAFLSVGKLVQEAMQGVMGAIERGGALNDLSARTGEAAGTLYQLQEAFKDSGLSVDALPGMINRFNKSLSGVGEMGEKTDEAFQALGLSADDLKRKDAPAQFEAVAQKLAVLDKASAFDIASRLFGRDGAANIMQISRDFAAFRDTIRDSAREAEIFARNAKAFDKLGDTTNTIKRHIGGMWAGLAEGLTPELQVISDKIARLDLTEFGLNLGQTIGDAFAAADYGKFDQYMSLLLKSQAQDFADQIGKSIGEAYGAAAGADYGSATRKALDFGLPVLGAADQFGPLGVASMFRKAFKATEFFGDPILRGAMGQENIYREQLGQLQADLRRKRSLENFNEILATAFIPIEELVGVNTGGISAPAEIGGTIAKPNASALEKIGFVFNGGSAFDPAKGTEKNTRRLVELNERMLKKIEQGGSSGSLVNK